MSWTLSFSCQGCYLGQNSSVGGATSLPAVSGLLLCWAHNVPEMPRSREKPQAGDSTQSHQCVPASQPCPLQHLPFPPTRPEGASQSTDPRMSSLQASCEGGTMLTKYSYPQLCSEPPGKLPKEYSCYSLTSQVRTRLFWSGAWTQLFQAS